MKRNSKAKASSHIQHFLDCSMWPQCTVDESPYRPAFRVRKQRKKKETIRWKTQLHSSFRNREKQNAGLRQPFPRSATLFFFFTRLFDVRSLRLTAQNYLSHQRRSVSSILKVLFFFFCVCVIARKKKSTQVWKRRNKKKKVGKTCSKIMWSPPVKLKKKKPRHAQKSRCVLKWTKQRKKKKQLGAWNRGEMKSW